MVRRTPVHLDKFIFLRIDPHLHVAPQDNMKGRINYEKQSLLLIQSIHR